MITRGNPIFSETAYLCIIESSWSRIWTFQKYSNFSCFSLYPYSIYSMMTVYTLIYIYTQKDIYIYVSYSIAYLYRTMVINQHFCWSYPLYIKIWSWYIFSLDLKILDPWNWDVHGSFKKNRTPKSKVIQKLIGYI